MPEYASRPCQHCGEWFRPVRSTKVFCSTLCGNRSRAARAGRIDRRIVIRDGQKQCTRCREWKSLDRYGKRRDRGDKPLSECKACASRRMCDYVRGERGRHMRYARKYGVTLEWYEGRLAEQGGVCAICRRPPEAERKHHPLLAIDHDHLTGKPRGLLCFRCNSGLGHFESEPELLFTAYAYLKAFVE